VSQPQEDPKRAFRGVLGMFPTGVAVITTETPAGERLGTTVSSFNAVSLDPPLVLFSLARSARSFAAWNEASTFAISVLSESQQRLSSQFAAAMTDKWKGLTAVPGRETGLPLLGGALAWFECRTWARYDGGDHVIMVGEVLAWERSQGESSRPLVFFNSRYAELAGGDGGIRDLAYRDLAYLEHAW
jgi:flavin reductase (DIM6/NTAB) family NADH-FMN oxidoreductase RutF